MFEWISTTGNSPVITLYSNNLTLNSVASTFFESSPWCCIGINKETLQIALRPVSKQEVELNAVAAHQLHKVSLGKGYGRISSKDLAGEISALIGSECNGQKYLATFNEKEKMLIVDLNNQVRR